MVKQKRPEVAIGAYIFNRKGEILLVKNVKWKGYVAPGGHVELGETIERTAKREVFEETGLRVKFEKVLDLQQAIYPRSFRKKKHFIFIAVKCTAPSTSVRLDNVELHDYLWIKPEKALRLKLSPFSRKSIKGIINKNRTKWFL